MQVVKMEADVSWVNYYATA